MRNADYSQPVSVTLFLYQIDVGKAFYYEASKSSKDDYSDIRLPANYDSVLLATSTQ